MNAANRTGTLTVGTVAVKDLVRLESIADRLRQVKDRYAGQNPLSARELAAALRERVNYRVSHTSVLAYESVEGGTEKVPASYLVAIVQAFGVNPTWLLMGDGPPISPDPTTAERAFEGIRRIVQLADVAPDQLDRVLGSLVDWDRIKRGGEGPP